MLFSECGLKPGLLRSVEHAGYKEATPIQEQVLKLALAGKNIVGQSQTGTGKTAAFLLPVLHQIDTNKKNLQVLILAPTRELVTQIGDEIRTLTKYYGVTYACLYGGASPNVQKTQLKRNPAIVVATPGRLMDFMNQKVINIGVVNYFILDEVDRMLDMGFVRDIKKIWAQMKNVKQTFTFSATMNNSMKTIIKEHVPHYEFVKVGDEVTVDKIDHRYVPIQHEQKLYNLVHILKEHDQDKVIVFTHTKRNTKTIQQILLSDGFNAGMLNGNMSQNKRQSTLNLFKQDKLQVLVTTDVAARGLNMENVGLVINFDVPADAKSYIHRIGRTGRAGAYGKAMMLVSPLERPLLQDIEREHKIKIKESPHVVVKDGDPAYGNVRLNRSTDKKGGRNTQQKKPRQGGQTNQTRPYAHKKPDKGENKYRGKSSQSRGSSAKSGGYSSRSSSRGRSSSRSR